jgi:hypothetical protein
MTGWSRGYGLGTKIPHTGSICSDRGCLKFLEINTGYPQNQHTDFSRMRDELSTQGCIQTPWFTTGCMGYLRKNIGLSPGSEDARGYLLQRSDKFTLRQSGRMEEEPPTQLISAIYLHVPGLTLVTHTTAYIPLACVPSIWTLLVLPKRNLGLNILFTCLLQ